MDGLYSELRYYHTDHLGSTRAVTDGSGQVVERRDHYPFGLQMPGRTLAQGAQTSEDYTGYEKDEETQFLYAGARYYMPALGRFGTTDRFADKYPALSPYNYAADDPANLIDVNGDSIDVSTLQEEHPEVLDQLKNELTAATGDYYTVNDDGMLVATNTETTVMGRDVKLKGVRGRSEKAADYVEHAIGHMNTLNVGVDNESQDSSYNRGLNIGLHTDTIAENREALSEAGIDPRSRGVGMAFLHESIHTRIGTDYYGASGRIKDPEYDERTGEITKGGPEPGATVSKVNAFRAQLPGYGQRLQYKWDGRTQEWRLNGNDITVRR